MSPLGRKGGDYTLSSGGTCHLHSLFYTPVRTLRTRGSGPAGADRQATILRVIADENRTLANPFQWTDQGKPLLT